MLSWTCSLSISVHSLMCTFVRNVTNHSLGNLVFWRRSIWRRIDELRNRFQRGSEALLFSSFWLKFAEGWMFHRPESFKRHSSFSSWTGQVVPVCSDWQGHAVSPGVCYFLSLGFEEAPDFICKRQDGGRLFQELLCIFHAAARSVAPG